ncbi:MAG: hypothetical protein MJA83_08750, partial [Gammaproteobacteria bacterium]|nr:hypothetical protein [Gammaproteobacteria bacterium]
LFRSAEEYFSYTCTNNLQENSISLMTWLEQKRDFIRKNEDHQKRLQSRQKMLSISTRFIRTERGYGANRAYVVEDHHEQGLSKEEHKVDITEEELEQCLIAQGIQRNAPDCTLCGGKHLLVRCSTYMNTYSDEERLRFLARDKRCFKCLYRNHTAPNCPNKKNCFKCQGEHHVTIHSAVMQRQNETTNLCDTEELQCEAAALNKTEATETHEEVPDLIDMAFIISQERAEAALKLVMSHIYLPTLPMTVASKRGTKSTETNVLLDSASTTTIIDEELYNALDLSGEIIQAKPVRGIGGRVNETIDQISTTVLLKSRDHSFEVAARVLRYPFPSSLKAIDWNSFKKDFDHLKEIDFPKPVANGKIGLLIGN